MFDDTFDKMCMELLLTAEVQEIQKYRSFLQPIIQLYAPPLGIIAEIEFQWTGLSLFTYLLTYC